MPIVCVSDSCSGHMLTKRTVFVSWCLEVHADQFSGNLYIALSTEPCLSLPLLLRFCAPVSFTRTPVLIAYVRTDRIELCSFIARHDLL
jgi:hypothetical protein